MNPVHPGMQLHRIDKTKDPNFWSVRVSRDVRLIVHKTDANLLLCYVDHHDAAYQWLCGGRSSGTQRRVLAPFAVDQAADLCSCGHENDDSAAGLKQIS